VSRRYGLHDRETGLQFTVKAEKFVLSTALRMLGWVPWVPSLGSKRLAMQLTPLLSNAEVKMRGATPPVPNTPSCCGAPHTNGNPNRCPSAACGTELQCNQVFGLSWCPADSDEQNGCIAGVSYIV